MQGCELRDARKHDPAAGVRLHNVSYATFLWTAFRGALRPILLGGLLLSAPSPGTPPAAAADSPPLWGYLDNGMGYLLLETHAAPLIGSSVIVHSGSAREEFATSGASHFLEHLLFNGTETRTQEQLYDAVDAIGGYNNATTRNTHVVFMMVTPAERIREGMEIQRDMLFHSTLPQEKVEKERGIILEEMARDRDAGAYELERAFDIALFGPAGPGLPVLGSEQSIARMPREAILDFYRKYYVARNMTLLVVGDFVPREMEKTIRAVFGNEPPGGTPPEFAYPEPVWDSAPAVSVHEGPSLALEWTWPGPDPRAPEYLAFECLSDLLAGDDTSPLNAAVRRRFAGKIQAAGGRIDAVPSRSFFRYRIEADPSVDWRELAGAMPGLLTEARVMPVREDFDAWRVSEETGEFFLRERPHYYGVIAGERIASEGLDRVVGRPERLARLSLAALSQLLPRWPAADSPRLTVVLPHGASDASTEAAAPAAVERSTLSNGTELLVLSSPESPVLALHLFVKGRSQAEPAAQDGAAELLHRLMATRTAKSDPETLSRRLRAIGAELKTADDPNIPYDDFYSGSGYTYVRLQTLDGHAEEAFGILAEILGPQKWTDEEFAEAQGAMIAQAERAAAGSRSRAREMTRNTLYGDRPEARAVFGTPKSLRGISAASLRDFAADYFVGRHFVLVAATSLPPDRVRDIASKSLGSLPAGTTPPLSPSDPVLANLRRSLRVDRGAAPLPVALAGGDSMIVLADSVGGRQATVIAVRALGEIPSDDFPALEVWNAIVSSKIQFQLREREGLAYSIGSSVERTADGTVLWYASAGTGAANIPRMVEGFDEGLRAGLEQPPDSTEIARQGVQIYGRSLMRRATRMNRAYAAGLAMMDGRDPAGIDDEIRAPMRVDRASVTRALAKLRCDGPGLLSIVR